MAVKENLTDADKQDVMAAVEKGMAEIEDAINPLTSKVKRLQEMLRSATQQEKNLRGEKRDILLNYKEKLRRLEASAREDRENRSDTLLRNAHLDTEVDLLSTEVGDLRQWVADLQNGMYINCVYCGHRYGPRETTPATLKDKGVTPTMAEALEAHIRECPEHPLSKALARIQVLEETLLEQGGLVIPEHPITFFASDPKDFSETGNPVFKEKGDWWFWSETWTEKHGPYGSQKSASKALDLYYHCCVEGDIPHVTQETWEQARKAESTNSYHPCTHWQAFQCECRGACSCHFEVTTIKPPLPKAQDKLRSTKRGSPGESMKQTAYLLAFFDVVDGVFQPVQWSLSSSKFQTQDLRLYSVVMAYGSGKNYEEGIDEMKRGLEACPGTNKSRGYLLERLNELLTDRSERWSAWNAD